MRACRAVGGGLYRCRGAPEVEYTVLRRDVDQVSVDALGDGDAQRLDHHLAAHGALALEVDVVGLEGVLGEDIILAAATTQVGDGKDSLAGIVLTGDLKPNPNVLRVIEDMPFPVLMAPESSYQVASKVHDLIVKTRPSDFEKIALIRDLIAENVDVKKILNSL